MDQIMEILEEFKHKYMYINGKFKLKTSLLEDQNWYIIIFTDGRSALTSNQVNPIKLNAG